MDLPNQSQDRIVDITCDVNNGKFKSSFLHNMAGCPSLYGQGRGATVPNLIVTLKVGSQVVGIFKTFINMFLQKSLKQKDTLAVFTTLNFLRNIRMGQVS